jgi:signal transduction histidine kinase
MLAALERARESERRFVADASHELRNPITALRGNAAYLLAHGADPETLADIHADAERLSRLLDDLLALAREDSGAVPDEPVDVADVARGAADGEAGVVVEANGPALVRGDRGALERALRNLVENAHRHGPPGGPVRVTVESAPATVVLAVTDSGEGIAPHLADAATGRFWRGPDADAAGGSGLGLAIVRATAERHGGNLIVDGPRFAIELPALRPLSEGEGDTADADRRRAL